ncbi:MAG: hypothetical protein JWL91_2675, partial [Sphingomonas bacterium]|nr:hypothetical protein [Sphingomonas bacterium]
AGRAASPVYNFTIHGGPGQSAEDIAKAVRKEIDKIDRERAAAARSAYREDPVGSSY